MSMDYDFHLDYFPVRGRIEPILLRLADSGVPFHLEEIRAATWMQWKKLHQITPDNFPFSGVPVLRTKDRSTRDGGKELVLGEVSAILTFLDEVLAGSQLAEALPLDVRMRIQMIKEASLFFIGRLLQTSGSSEWLAPPQRTIVRKGIVARYLRDTERALGDLQGSIRVVPLPTDQLSGMSTAVVAAINLITDVFPSTREMLMAGGECELCGRLWHTVRGRAGIKEYWKRNKIEQKAWSITEYGTAEWIAKEAASFDRVASLL